MHLKSQVNITGISDLESDRRSQTAAGTVPRNYESVVKNTQRFGIRLSPQQRLVAIIEACRERFRIRLAIVRCNDDTGPLSDELFNDAVGSFGIADYVAASVDVE